MAIFLDIMDFITKSPGLFHISERIFFLLNYYDFLKCENVNDQWKNILRATNWFWRIPHWFWLKKYSDQGLLPANIINDWITVIQNVEKPNLTIHYFMKNLELRPSGILCSPFLYVYVNLWSGNDEVLRFERYPIELCRIFGKAELMKNEKIIKIF